MRRKGRPRHRRKSGEQSRWSRSISVPSIIDVTSTVGCYLSGLTDRNTIPTRDGAQHTHTHTRAAGYVHTCDYNWSKQHILQSDRSVTYWSDFEAYESGERLLPPRPRCHHRRHTLMHWCRWWPHSSKCAARRPSPAHLCLLSHAFVMTPLTAVFPFSCSFTHAHTDTLLTLGPLRAVRASRSNSQPHTHTPASGIFRARESVCGRVWRKLSLTGHDRNTLSLRAHPSAPATCRVTEMCHIRTQTQARRCFSLVAPCSAC